MRICCPRPLDYSDKVLILAYRYLINKYPSKKKTIIPMSMRKLTLGSRLSLVCFFTIPPFSIQKGGGFHHLHCFKLLGYFAGAHPAADVVVPVEATSSVVANAVAISLVDICVENELSGVFDPQLTIV